MSGRRGSRQTGGQTSGTRHAARRTHGGRRRGGLAVALMQGITAGAGVLWRRLLILLLLAASAGAQAGVRIAERAWLGDPTGRLTLAQVQAQAAGLRPYAGILSRGYQEGVHWIRLRVGPDAATATAAASPGRDAGWVLRIRPALLDEVALFDPLAADPATGVIRPAYTGDLHRWRDGSCRALDLGFAIPASSQPPTSGCACAAPARTASISTR